MPSAASKDAPRSELPRRDRVILLTGPSGAGKSRLAARLNAAHGWPVIRLDDFYRELTDPGLPRSPIGIPDWDHPDSWNAGAAIVALRQLVDEGATEVPVYDIGTSSVTGRHTVTAGPTACIVAEGLFAARLIAPLRAEGLLADALCVRDLAERRKPPHILVQRGWALLKDEPQVISAAMALGANCVTPKEAEARYRAAPRPVRQAN